MIAAKMVMFSLRVFSFPLLGVGDFYIPKVRGQYTEIIAREVEEEKESSYTVLAKCPFREETVEPPPKISNNEWQHSTEKR